MLGIPTLANTPLIVLSYYREACIEAVAPVLAAALLATVLVINYAEILGEVTVLMHHQQAYLIALLYYLGSQFLAATWFPSLVLRGVGQLITVTIVWTSSSASASEGEQE